MSSVPCCSATNIISERGETHQKERTRGMPEVDDQPQYNDGERREVKPVRFEMLDEIVLESCNNSGAKRTKRKSPVIYIDQAIVGRGFKTRCVPKRRPKKSLESRLKLKYAEEARR
jgi:hypothetical protein